MKLTPVRLSRAPRSRVLVALALAAGSALCIAGGLGAEGLLCMAPALALASALLARRYPGERRLSALAARRRSARPRTPGVAQRTRRSRICGRVPRGGLLMGFALAVRPPPAASSSAS